MGTPLGVPRAALGGVDAGFRTHAAFQKIGRLHLGMADAAGPFTVGGTQEVVEHADRHYKMRRDLIVSLDRGVKAVQTVKVKKAVSGREKVGFPFLVRLYRRARRRGFNQDNPGAIGREIRTGQRVLFAALDVDLQEVDYLRRVVATDVR